MRIETGVLWQWIYRYHQPLGLCLFSLIIFFIETGLIEYRFGIFDSPTRWSDPLDQFSEKIAFVAISVSIDLLLSGLLFFVWLRLWRSRSTHVLVLGYHFFMLWGSFYLFCVGAKFKVLSYFNDTVSFSFIKELAGGQLFAALRYVLNEALGAIIVLLLLLSLYALGHRWVRGKLLASRHQAMWANDFGKINIKTALIAFTVLIGLVVGNQGESDLRYVLRQTLSHYWLSNIIAGATDFDGDGYSQFIFPKDDSALNPAIHPQAVDVPDNNIDENQINGDFKLSAASDYIALSPVKAPAGQGQKHVVLVILESLRADVLNKKIENTVVAPNLNALAVSGSRIDDVFSHSGYTATSLKALFNQDLIFNAASGYSSLADFKQQGYAIAVFSGQSENFGDIAEQTGMKKYADVFFDADSAPDDKIYGDVDAHSLRLDARRVYAEFEQYAKRVDWQRSQFVYINLQSAHFPYSHEKMPSLLLSNPIPRSEINEKNRAWLEKSYWNAVQYADQVLGHIIQLLKQQGVWDQTLVIVSGDHGESLFDREWSKHALLGHGHAINNIQTAIPLVFSRPGISLPAPVGQIEILNVARRWAGIAPKVQDRAGSRKMVLQYIGTLTGPAQIAMVEAQNVRTLFDFRNQKFWFEERKQWMNWRQAQGDPQLARRASGLISVWENILWRANSVNVENKDRF